MGGVETVAGGEPLAADDPRRLRVPLLRLRPVPRAALLHRVPPGDVVGASDQGRAPAGGVPAVDSARAVRGCVSGVLFGPGAGSRADGDAALLALPRATTSTLPSGQAGRERRCSRPAGAASSSVVDCSPSCVATWLRFPGSLPLGFIVLVFGTVWMLDPDRTPLNTWPWFAPYVSCPSWFDDVWTLRGVALLARGVPRRVSARSRSAP